MRDSVRTTEDGDAPAFLPSRVDTDDDEDLNSEPNLLDQVESSFTGQANVSEDPSADSSTQDDGAIDANENELPENARDVTETNHVEEPLVNESNVEGTPGEAIPQQDETEAMDDGHDESKPNENEEYNPADQEETVQAEEEVQTESENHEDSKPDENTEDKPAETQASQESLSPQEEIQNETLKENEENLDDTKLQDNEDSKPSGTEESPQAKMVQTLEGVDPSPESAKATGEVPSETHDETSTDPNDIADRGVNQPVAGTIDDSEESALSTKDETPTDPNAYIAERDVNQSTEETIDDNEETTPSSEGISEEQEGEKVEDDDVNAEIKVQEAEHEEGKEQGETEESPSEPVEGLGVLDAGYDEANGQDHENESVPQIQRTADKQEEIASPEQGVDSSEPTEDQATPQVNETTSEETATGEEGAADDAPSIPAEAPSRTSPSEEAQSKTDEEANPEATIKARPKPDLSVLKSEAPSSSPEQQEGESNESTGAKLSAATPPSADSSVKSKRSRSSNSSNPWAPRAPRVPRKKRVSGASGGSGEQQQDDGDETEGTKRPKFTGNLSSLHKPDNIRNRRRIELADGGGEQDLIPTPGAYALGSTPSQDDVLVNANGSSDQASQSDGSLLNETGTITTTAVLAQEVDEDRELLRREVSHLRRERDNVAVVSAVEADVVDGQKGDANEGMSSTRKFSLLVLLAVLIGGGAAAYSLLGKDTTGPSVAISLDSDLPCVSENLTFPLGLCVGDCDTDDHCAQGLVCFQREQFEPVPGCSCGEKEDSLTDYCVTEQLPPLVLLDNPDPGNFSLALCHGDCDLDTHCDEGLVCFQREPGQEVPQCTGGAEDESRSDYCIKSEKEEEAPLLLGECQGQCSEDSDCERGLFCYQDKGDIPGCLDIANGPGTGGHCVEDVHRGPEVTESNSIPLGRCEGDCDDDTDCHEGYFCYQRVAFQRVPGCTGGEADDSKTDFCTNETYRESTPLLPWGDQLVGSPGENFGSSASLSGNGNILVVGVVDIESAGYVNIYTATETDASGISQTSVIWTKETSIVGEAGTKAFGSKSALSSDGRTLVVGSVVVPTTGRLAARIQVFQATDTGSGTDFSNWASVETRISTEMIGDTYDGDKFDFSVSISGDGKFVALGQPSNGGDKPDSIQRGPLIFRLEQDNGIDVLAFLGAPYSSFYAGSSVTVSTSPDGNPRVAIGGDNSVRGPGQVRAMELLGDDASKPAEKEHELLGWFEVANSIGQSDHTMVEFSSDGTFMALSITNRTSLPYQGIDGVETEAISLDGPEHVLVYQFKMQGVDDYWDQIGNLIGVETSDVSHIPTVALSGDAKVLAVGEPWVNLNTGRVRVFRYNQSTNRWQPLQSPIEGQTQGERFGSTISLVSSDMGSAALAVGGPFSASNQFGRGSVTCYRVPEDSMGSENSLPMETSSNSQTSTSNLRGSASKIQEIELEMNWST